MVLDQKSQVVTLCCAFLVRNFSPKGPKIKAQNRNRVSEISWLESRGGGDAKGEEARNQG